jgi:drug/metabolite transporter (DMT)-like permease
VAVLVGLIVAASFGSGDFLGGLASRKAGTITVLALAQVVAVVLAAIVAFAAGGRITEGSLLLGAGAGALGIVALGCLYQALAIGQIGEVAPVAAVVGAVIPVAWGLAIGEHPGAVALCGGVLAVVAAGLITLERDERKGPKVGRARLLALAAGLGFGTSFILFAEASHHSGFWPVLTARLAGVVVVGIVMFATRAPRSLPARPMWLAIGAGVLDVSGTVLLLVAIRLGLVAVVAPVASLSPAFTVVGAWWYLREKASKLQVIGIGLALLGLSLIATS